MTTAPRSDTANSLEFRGVSAGYGSKMALERVTFRVPHGARVAVIGPNGAGKSTLFKALVQLLPLREGAILIHGEPLGRHKDCVAYVPQRGEVDWRFPVTVRDVVMMGRFSRQGWLRRPSRTDRAVVTDSLDQMGMLDTAGEAIADLSGGQQQRVFLARALAQEPHILLMDEPFTGVDLPAQEQTFRLLDSLRDQQVTALVSTHDLNAVAERFDLVAVLRRTLVAFGPPAEALTADVVKTAFGHQALTLGDTLVVDRCCPDE